MPNKISVLTPVSTDKEGRTRIEAQLETDSDNILKELTENTEREKVERKLVLLTARLIYMHLCHAPGYMTWDTLRNAMKKYQNLDEAIKYLLTNGFIKEAWLVVEE